MLVRLVVALALWSWSQTGIEAASALVLPGDQAVVVATEDGRLQFWEQGAEEPRWTLRIGGIALGARSTVADMARRPNGEIIVVERAGAINLISAAGKLLIRKQPIFEYIQLNVEFSDVDWSDWGKQIAVVARTSAAYITPDAKFIYLVPDAWSVVVKIPVDEFLASKDDLVSTSNNLVFQFVDRNFTVVRKIGALRIPVTVRWPVGESLSATALAVCRGTMIAGTEEGRVAFAPEVGDQVADGRLRVVAKENDGIRSILDAGCLGINHAYTVSFDAGNGQLQLWDLKTKSALDWVGLESGGHPGMAFAAVPSKSGATLLSIGDGDVRLWNVGGQKLRLIAKHYPRMRGRHRSFAAAALGGGGFLYWDGARILRLTESGEEPLLFAGRR